MKFKVDIDTNNAFIQIFGITETLKLAETPLAFQVRGGLTLVERMAKTLEKVHAEIKRIDAEFHDNDHAKFEFEGGVVVFTPGEIPVTAVVQQRLVTIMIGTRQLGDGPIKTEPLLKALNEAMGVKESIKEKKKRSEK